jgi:hypothetical protein
VLSEGFDEVVLLQRDELPTEPAPRESMPVRPVDLSAGSSRPIARDGRGP